MPPRYWLYVWGISVIFFALSYVAYSPEEVASGIMSSIAVAGFFTLWLAITHALWYAGHILLKILAVIFGGIVLVVLALVIQFVYENFVWKRKVATSS